VLVTGASGNVGSELVGRLLAKNERVTVATRAGRADTPSGVRAVAFDFGDSSTFGSALEGVDRVFFMRPPHMSDAKAFRPFIDAMEHAGVGHVVFLSVQGAGQNVFVPHRGIEVLLKRSRLAWTFLRPSFFMQNLTTTHLADIRDRDEIWVPAGRGRTNFIDAVDVAEAATVCLTTAGHERRAYEITGSEALTYDEVAAVLSGVCGRRISYPRPSAKQFKQRMKEYGHDDELVRVMDSIYAIAKFGLATGTTDTFVQLTGRQPHTLVEWACDNATVWTPLLGVPAREEK
jgi:uncharacterized protein YbjT (DUF2867 family)